MGGSSSNRPPPPNKSDAPMDRTTDLCLSTFFEVAELLEEEEKKGSDESLVSPNRSPNASAFLVTGWGCEGSLVDPDTLAAAAAAKVGCGLAGAGVGFVSTSSNNESSLASPKRPEKEGLLVADPPPPPPPSTGGCR